MYDTAARCQELVDAKIHDLSFEKLMQQSALLEREINCE